MERLKIIAFTHKHLDLEKIGSLHIESSFQEARLTNVKYHFAIDELLFLSTCNRVEFVLACKQHVSKEFISSFVASLYPQFTKEQADFYAAQATVFSGIQAVDHLLRVSSSIDSMVIGEREIITQVRTAYEHCKNIGLTGDFIRILIRNNIETAKKVYTHTRISTHPVSVVSLAYHRLKELNIALNARILIIGAGATNTNMLRFLKKHGFNNFTIFNRTLSKAEKLANAVNGKAYSLNDLATYTQGFDVIISCTGAEGHIITRDLYLQLLQGENGKKVVIDIAIPNDLDPAIVDEFGVKHISVEYLRKISEANQKERSKEIEHVELILQEALNDFVTQSRLRKVEIAMREVPEKIKAIHHNAIHTVFAEDLQKMDATSRETLEKIMAFVEKKYISVPMKIAKEIFVENTHQ